MLARVVHRRKAAGMEHGAFAFGRHVGAGAVARPVMAKEFASAAAFGPDDHAAHDNQPDNKNNKCLHLPDLGRQTVRFKKGRVPC